MAVRVNGKEHAWQEGMTVQDLLDSLNPEKTPVVVKVGRNTVSRKDFATFAVPDRAEIYFLFLIAGG
jgi:thiamine biosynthesis protein ThiS